MPAPGYDKAPVKQQSFPKIREARELLMAKAKEIVEFYIKNAQEAHADGKYEVTSKALEFLIRHMPTDEDGLTLIEGDAGEPKQIDGPKGPQINIGFALGGINTPKELPPVVIDVTPVETPDVKPD